LAEAASPLGRCCVGYLRAARLYDRLVDKALWVDNSRAVLAAVASQAADVGLVFVSDAERQGDWRLLFRVPLSKAAATYEAAAIGPKGPSAESQELLDFLDTSAARRCFRRCGLRPVIR
jgi:ABC-type molybdate transport system substrate-binding protein